MSVEECTGRATLSLAMLIQNLGVLSALVEHRDSLHDGYEAKCSQIEDFCQQQVQEMMVFGKHYDDRPYDQDQD